MYLLFHIQSYSVGKTDEAISAIDDGKLLETVESNRLRGDHLPPQPKKINEMLIQAEEANKKYVIRKLM